MSLKVRPWLYRLVWISVAVVGALSVAGLVSMLLFNESITVNDGAPTLIATGIIGAFMLAYALWRLLRPLRAPPKN